MVNVTNMSTSHHVRILHLSDVHFRSAEGDLPAARIEQVKREEFKRMRVLGKAWSNNLLEVVASTPPVDIVCITGDIADWGLSQEYVPATAFIEGLLSSLGLGRERLFMVPGNHDIQRRVEFEAWSQFRNRDPRVNPQELSDWMAGGPTPLGIDDSLREKVLRRGAAYREWTDKVLRRPELLPSNSPHGKLGYRHTLTLPGRPFPIHVVGLDSAWLAGDDKDPRQLLMTEQQVWRLASQGGRELEGLRIALVHHPLTDLADAETTRRDLAKLVDLLLRGHQHEPLAETWSDPSRRMLEFAAGCLYEGSLGHKYANAFQVIDIETDGNGRPRYYNIWFRSFSSRDDHWFDDASLYRNAKGGRLRLDARGNAAPSVSPAEKAASVRIATGLTTEQDLRLEDVRVRAKNTAVAVVSDVVAGGSIEIRNLEVTAGSEPNES